MVCFVLSTIAPVSHTSLVCLLDTKFTRCELQVIDRLERYFTVGLPIRYVSSFREALYAGSVEKVLKVSVRRIDK